MPDDPVASSTDMATSHTSVTGKVYAAAPLPGALMKQTTISVQDLSGSVPDRHWTASRHPAVGRRADVGHLGREGRDVHADARAVRPVADIQAFAPVEIAAGGVVAWRGRIVDAPTNSPRAPSPSAARRRTTSTTTSTSACTSIPTSPSGRTRAAHWTPTTLWRAAGLVTSGDGVIFAELACRDSGTPRCPWASSPTSARLRSARRRRNSRSDASRATRRWWCWRCARRSRSTGCAAPARSPTASRPWRSAPPLPRRRPSRPPQPDRPLRLRAAALRHDVHPDAGGRDRHRRDPGVHRHGLRQWQRRQRASRRPGRGTRSTPRRSSSPDDQSLIDSTGSPSTSPSSPPAAPGPQAGHRGCQRFYDWRTKVDEQDRFGSRTARARPRRCAWDAGVPPASRTPPRRPATRFTTRPSSPARTRAAQIREVVTSGDLSNVVYEDITRRASLEPRIRERHVRVGGQRSTITQGHDSAHRPYGGRWDNSGASDALSMNDHLEITLTGTFLAGVRYRIYPWIRARTPARPPPQFQVGDFATGDVTLNVYNRLPGA